MNPRSDINVSVLEGRLLAVPTTRPAGDSVVTEASIATTEHWMRHGEPKEKTSYLGIVAHGHAGETLAQCQKGQAVVIVGRWCTVEGEPGPRGGRTTSTKCRAIHVFPRFGAEVIQKLLELQVSTIA